MFVLIALNIFCTSATGVGSGAGGCCGCAAACREGIGGGGVCCPFADITTAPTRQHVETSPSSFIKSLLMAKVARARSLGSAARRTSSKHQAQSTGHAAGLVVYSRGLVLGSP